MGRVIPEKVGEVVVACDEKVPLPASEGPDFTVGRASCRGFSDGGDLMAFSAENSCELEADILIQDDVHPAKAFSVQR